MVQARWLLPAVVLVAACGGGADIPQDVLQSDAPTVRLEPAAGPCGERVTVLGGGFDGDTAVLALFPGTFEAPPEDEPLRSFSVVRLTTDGAFRTTMRMGPEEVAADLCAEGTVTLVASTDVAVAVAHYRVE